jgi:hypothetical protein
VGLTWRPAREERETGAFFPLSFSAVLAAVVLAASRPLPPFPAIYLLLLRGNRQIRGGQSRSRRRPAKPRGGEGALPFRFPPTRASHATRKRKREIVFFFREVGFWDITFCPLENSCYPDRGADCVNIRRALVHSCGQNGATRPRCAEISPGAVTKLPRIQL